MAQPTLLDRSLDLMKVDFAPRHRQPTLARLVVATVLSIGGSLLADALLVVVGTLFPSTDGYGHFRLHDYAALTVTRILIAGLAGRHPG